jgi:hypothetical protein
MLMAGDVSDLSSPDVVRKQVVFLSDSAQQQMSGRHFAERSSEQISSTN